MTLLIYTNEKVTDQPFRSFYKSSDDLGVQWLIRTTEANKFLSVSLSILPIDRRHIAYFVSLTRTQQICFVI